MPRQRGTRLALLFSCVVCLGAMPEGAEAAVKVDGGRSGSNLSAWGGVATWSSGDESAKRFRLWVRVGGVTRAAPFGPLPFPFEPDVGPDRRGRPVIVLSTGRTIISYDPTTGRKRTLLRLKRLRAGNPTIWKNNLSFFTAATKRGRTRWTVHSVDLRTGRDIQVRAVVKGAEKGQPKQADLYGKRLLFNWSFESACTPVDPHGGNFATTSQVWEVTGHVRRRLDDQCQRPIMSPLYIGSQPSWLRANDSAGRASTTEFVRGGSTATLPGSIVGLAFDGTHYFTNRSAFPALGTPYELVESDDPSGL